MPRPVRRSRWPEWWFYVLLFFVGLQVLFYVVPHAWPGELGMLCWMLGQDSFAWIVVVGALAFMAFVRALIRRPFVTTWRVVAAVLLAALLLSPFAFRIYPSSHTGKIPAVVFRVPMDGLVTVGWGGDSPDVNYHVAYPDQRWAYDLVMTRDGKSHAGDGTKHEDFYCWDVPVVAPADGEVVFTRNDDPDVPIGQLGGGTDAGGNQVGLKVAEGHYLVLCHLRQGSVTVKVGDKVTAGQVVGRVGNSGNTSEPHLHVHLQDAAPPDLGEGIPLYFYGYRTGGQVVERGMPTGGFNDSGWAGQVVEHVPAK